MAYSSDRVRMLTPTVAMEPMSKEELVAMYTEMCESGESDLVKAEVLECTRLKELYATRLCLLLNRDPALELVKEQRVHLYAHYEMHFRNKIIENAEAMEAASEALEKWRSHDAACELVKSVFVSMGGTVVSPTPERRPRHIPQGTVLDRHRDAFMMDFENEIHETKFQELTLYCTKHHTGPLDVWYDCDACQQEVREGPMPQDGRYTRVPLRTIINGSPTPRNLR